MSENRVAAGPRRTMIGVGAVLYGIVVACGLLVLGQSVWQKLIAPQLSAPAEAMVPAPSLPQETSLGDMLEGESMVPEASESPDPLGVLDPLMVWAGLIPRVNSADSAEPISPTLVASPAPEDLFVEGVPAGRQARNLSCEAQSASDLARYYGKRCTWQDILKRVGNDPGGNPHKGFVGNVNDMPGQLYPHGYGVYAEPIARALSELGLPAQVCYGRSEEWLRQQLAQGHPVMVWVTSRMRDQRVEYWRAKDGTQIRAVRYEHTCLLVGCSPDGVWLNDPGVGQMRYYSWDVFLRSWDLLERMSVVIED